MNNTSDIFIAAAKICDEAGAYSISLLKRRLIGDYNIILGYKECAQLLEEIKQFVKEKINEN